MSKTLPYNVVLTRSPKVAKKLFFQKLTDSDGLVTVRRLNNIYSRLTEDEKRETLIVSPFNNNGFISLINEYPAGGKRFTTIRMLESSKILENLLIPRNPYEEHVTQRFKKRVTNLETIDNETTQLLSEVRPRFYIAYGLGDDVSEWAGPYVIDLIDINLSINPDGVRELEMAFTPTIDSLKSFSNKQYIDQDLSQGQSVFDTLNTISNKIPRDFLLEFDLESNFILEGVVVGRLPELNKVEPIPKGGFNKAIRSCLRKYLSNNYATIPLENILVLFSQDLDISGEDPNAFFRRPVKEFTTPLLNVGVRGSGLIKASPAITFQKLYTDILAEYGLNCSHPPDTEAAQEAIDKSLTMTREKLRVSEEILKKNNNQLKKLQKELVEATARLEEPAPLAPGIRSDSNALQSLVQRNRLRDETIPKIESDISKLENEIKIMFEDTLNDYFDQLAQDSNLVTEENPPANQDAATEAEPVPIDTKKIRIGFYTDHEPGEVNANILEGLKPLYQFFRKLKSKTDQAFDPIIFEESDVRILSLLRKHGLIADGTASVVVIGDRDLIRNMLYSDSNLPSLGSALKYESEIKPPIQGGLSGLSKPNNSSDLKSRWEAYKEEMRLVLYPRKFRTSSYNEEPDFGIYNKSFKKRVTKESIILMHNLKNSNVLSMSLDTSPYKLELLSIANESSYALLDQALLGNQTVLDNSLNLDIIDYVKDKLLNDKNKDGVALSNDIPAILEVMSNDREIITKLRAENVLRSDGRDFLDLLRFRLNGKELSKDLKIKNPPGKTVKTDADILRRANRYLFTASVRTLPFFNTVDYFGRDCLLIGAPNRIVGSTIDTEPGKVPEPFIFSNNYNIYGYKHVLNNDEAYSEFMLYNPDFGTPGDTMRLSLGQLLGLSEGELDFDRGGSQ